MQASEENMQASPVSRLAPAMQASDENMQASDENMQDGSGRLCCCLWRIVFMRVKWRMGRSSRVGA
jgi:hypothetical protein